MRRKLKECQDVWIQEYQHNEEYIEGDKVWFQPLNGNAWLGPALVVCQSVRDLKKIAYCRVKLFELVDRDEESVLVSKDVMLEDGLEDFENLFTDLKNDEVGASHLITAQSVSFSEMCTYTV